MASFSITDSSNIIGSVREYGPRGSLALWASGPVADPFTTLGFTQS